MAQEEGVDPFHLLSEELWLKVFKYLDSDPREMINVGATSTQFQNLLEEKKVGGRDAGQGACYLEQVVPLLLKWLPKTEALHLHLSCQRVSQLVDRLIDENERITVYENLGLVPRLMPPHILHLTWPRHASYEFRNFKIGSYQMGKTIASLVDIENMEKKLKENKILGKSITVIVSSSKEENLLREFAKTSPPGTIVVPHGWDSGRLVDYSILHQRNFLDKSIQLFTEYPRNFKYVELISSQMTSYQEFHGYFRRIVASLPHLLHLKMDFVRRFFSEAIVTAEKPFTPLPPSTKLELVSIQQYMLPDAFIRQLAVKYGGNLKSLEVKTIHDSVYMTWTGRKLWKEELEDDGRQYEFPALLDLTINDWEQSNVVDLGRINAPQLKRLVLNIIENEEYCVDGLQLIKMILLFPSVKFLQIWLIPKIMKHPKAALEALDTIQERHQNIVAIALHGPVFTSNLPLRLFAVLCPHAYSMEICASDLEDATQDEDLKLLRDRRFEESRIWIDAPNLEEVRLVDSKNAGSGPYFSHRPSTTTG